LYIISLLLCLMVNAQDTKLIYKQGFCFSFQKCLYCEVDLQKQKCKCNIT